MVRVAALQIDIALGNPERNRNAIARLAESTDADLVVFPECALSGYAFDGAEEARAHAEPIPGPTTEVLRSVAISKRRCIVVGMLERKEDRMWNSAVLVTPDGKVAKYRKTHLPCLGVDRFVAPGDRLPVFDTPVGRLGVQICYDLRFPESARCLALEGVEILVVPTNWPRGAEAIPEILLPARAVENGVFVVAANRVGTENKTEYIGQSAIIDPRGKTLAILKRGEGAVIAEVNPAQAREKHIIRKPGEYEIDLVADRRPDLYGPLVRTGGKCLN